MTTEHSYYLETGHKISGSEESQMFGKPCFKINGKAFISFFENELVCKLTGDAHKKALALKGAKLFDPSGKGRAMKEWVQIPGTHKKLWAEFAEAALIYVKQSQK
jgi:hypothetical protein